MVCRNEGDRGSFIDIVFKRIFFKDADDGLPFHIMDEGHAPCFEGAIPVLKELDMNEQIRWILLDDPH
jgi:hypothetical protein